MTSDLGVLDDYVYKLMDKVEVPGTSILPFFLRNHVTSSTFSGFFRFFCCVFLNHPLVVSVHLPHLWFHLLHTF